MWWKEACNALATACASMRNWSMRDTDRHLWAELMTAILQTYSRFKVRSRKNRLSTSNPKLSPQEKRPSRKNQRADLTAYDLYIRAKTLIATSVFSTPQAESLSEAVRLLNEAIERDPAFALAYYQLAHAHDLIYFAGPDHTPARLAMADGAIQSLTRLLPNSGEAHLALAKHFYWGYLDYDLARTNSVWHRRVCLTSRWRLCWPAISIDGKGAGMNRPKILSALSSSTRKTLPSFNNSLLAMIACAVMPMKRVYTTAQSLLLPKMQRCELHVRRSNSTGMPIRVR